MWKERRSSAGTEEGSGQRSGRKAGQMGESQTRRASLPWSLLPRPVFHPTAAVLLSVAVSLSKSSEGSKIGVKPSRWPSRSLSRPSAWGPAQGWEVTLAFSIDLRSFCACHRPFLAPRVQPRCSQVLAAQLGFFAGFLGTWSSSQAPPSASPLQPLLPQG